MAENDYHVLITVTDEHTGERVAGCSYTLDDGTLLYPPDMAVLQTAAEWIDTHRSKIHRTDEPRYVELECTLDLMGDDWDEDGRHRVALESWSTSETLLIAGLR